MGNLIALTIRTLGGGGGGVGEDGVDVGEVGGGVDGGGNNGMRFFINFLAIVKSRDCSLILRSLGNLFRSALPQTSMDSHNPFFT